jgi:hypothetical protein
LPTPLPKTQVLAASIYVTSAQAIRALDGFHARLEQVRACLSLLPSLEDLFNMPLVLDSLAPEAQAKVNACLGALRTFSPANPTGSYLLNLGHAVDFAVAQRLLTCWAVEVQQGICRRTELEVGAFVYFCKWQPDLNITGVSV